MTTFLLICAAISAIDWHAIPDKLNDWLDAFDLAEECREG